MKKVNLLLPLVLFFTMVSTGCDDNDVPIEQDCTLSEIRVFELTSSISNRPQVELVLPPGWKAIGGGATASCPGTTCVFFTELYPVNTRKWIAKAKDHIYPVSTTITIKVVAIYDPDDKYDVRIFEHTSSPAHFPETQVAVESGYVFTGGGARSNSNNPGIMLTASGPVSQNTWAVRGKDHKYSSIGTITAYAIGIKSNDGCQLENAIFTNTSESSHYPSGSASVDSGWTLTGGGAKANWQTNGSFLIGSFPSGLNLNEWKASAKDLHYPEQVTLTIYAIGIRFF